MKNRAKAELTRGLGVGYDQCFQESDYHSQYEEECPVNYSLKYSETESCKGPKHPVNPKVAFKQFDTYEEEPDLSEPTNFSLKYGEKPAEDDGDMKDSEFDYYETEKEEYKGFADYAETDLDQPTDFTLKYGESSDEEVKGDGFTFYEADGEKVKGSSARFRDEAVAGEGSNECDTVGLYACEDETPLMFSRCSSLTSLSSFEHITQAIPDDRSSIVSEFSRTTSGIISPSELPDSPTQTAPSSPKRGKAFCLTGDLRQKKSVFEDDVTTYKQEDTPIEFSRATSLSSLNIDHPAKTEFNLKTNSSASSVAGGDDTKPKDAVPELKRQEVKPQKGKVSFVSEVDDILSEGIEKIRIEPNRGGECLSENLVARRMPPPPPPDRVVSRVRSDQGFAVKSRIRPIFSNATFEASDDDVHTYHTEGTPANISHAGSHSDLSTLSMISGIPPSGTENNSDEEGEFCPGMDEPLPETCEPHKRTKDDDRMGPTRSSPVDMTMKRSPDDVKMKSTSRDHLNFNNQARLDYLRSKDRPHSSMEGIPLGDRHQNCSPGFSYASPKPSVYANRFASCKSRSEPIIPLAGNIFRFSPSFTGREGNDKEMQTLMNQQFSKEEYVKGKGPRSGSPLMSKSVKDLHDDLLCCGPEASSLSVDNWLAEPCTPLEEDLVEQCIRLGMPNRTGSKKLDENDFKPVDDRSPDIWYLKSCTPLEEALVEQCIRLGMPQKNKKVESSSTIGVDDGKTVKDCDSYDLIRSTKVTSGIKASSQNVPVKHVSPSEASTGGDGPFPVGSTSGKSDNFQSLVSDNWYESCTAAEDDLVEQCIRLGMSHKSSLGSIENGTGKSSSPAVPEEPVRGSSVIATGPVGTRVSRSRSNVEKEKDTAKKPERFLTNPGRRHTTRRKKSRESCKRCKKCRERLKASDHLKS